MKIYFAGSIRGGREDEDLYRLIISYLGNFGSVLTEHVGGRLTSYGEVEIPDQKIFERDTTWVSEADVVVAEVSTPSLGVGYELGYAESLGKKVLCLFRPFETKRLSAMVAGNSKFTIKEYNTVEEACERINDFFK